MCHTFWALSEQRLWLFKSLKVQINKCVRAAETNPFLCCLEQLFAVTVVSASSPDFCNCSWRWRDVLRTLQVVWDKVTSRFQGDESSWAKKEYFLRLWSHKRDCFTTHSRTQTFTQLFCPSVWFTPCRCLKMWLRFGFKCPRELFQLFYVLLDGTKQENWPCWNQ